MKDRIEHFEHDVTAHNHPKIKALKVAFGFEGIGRFWTLNEIVGDSPDCKLDLTQKLYKANLADTLGLTMSQLDEFLTFLADQTECGLVTYEDGILTTKRTQENWTRLQAYRQKEKDKKGKYKNPKGKEENPRGIPGENGENPTGFSTSFSLAKLSSDKAKLSLAKNSPEPIPDVLDVLAPVRPQSSRDSPPVSEKTETWVNEAFERLEVAVR